MKVVLRVICVVALALVLVGLSLHLSAGNLSASSEVSRDALGAGLVNLGGKLSIIVAIIAALYAVQRNDWRWVIALAIFALCTLLSGPLSALTNTGVLVFVLAPAAVALIALIYTFRLRGDLSPTQAWWRV